MKILLKYLKSTLCVVFLGVLLSGCLSTSLQTSATMSQTIFLNPVAKDKKSVFLNIKNTSGENVNLEPKLRSLLQAKGYEIVDEPALATYILSTNVLYCNRKQENNAVPAAVAGGAAGAGISIYNSDSAGGAVAATAAGALIGGLLGKLSEDTIWQMQVDVNVRQKSAGKIYTQNASLNGGASVRDTTRSGALNSLGGAVRDDKSGHLSSNAASATQQSFEDDYIEKSTTVFAEAIKSGLTLSEATPILEDKIAAQISGLF